MDLNQLADARGPGHTPGVKRLPNIKALTSIRFFAALHVALFHYVHPYSRWGFFAPVVGAGYVGVSFFFILSGFILTYSHSHESERGKGLASKFWMARFARIYPVYLLSMIFAACITPSVFHKKIHILVFIADLLMVQSWSMRMIYFFNGPAWSLSCEALFYFIFPFIFLRLRPASLKKGIFALTMSWLFAIAFPLLCLKFYPEASWHLPHSSIDAAGAMVILRVRHVPIFSVPQFIAGISLGWIFIRFRPTRKMASFLATSGVIIFAAILVSADHIPLVLLHNGVLIPVFAMIILGLTESNWLSRILSNPVLVLFGEASYALYLIHIPFEVWLKSIWGPSDTILAAVWKLALVIPISICLHLFVERPCRRMILQWWSRRHPAELTVAPN